MSTLQVFEGFLNRREGMWSNQATAENGGLDVEDELEYYAKTEKMSVKCVCPKCGITHVLKFFWSGRGTPRRYCHRCRETIVTVDSEYVYETGHDDIRRHRGAMSSCE